MPSFTSILLAALASVQVAQGAHPSISRSAQCGATYGLTCKGSSFGNCCSKNGWCGSSKDYCGDGCQSAWGDCGVESTPAAASVTPSATVSSTKASATCGVKEYAASSNDLYDVAKGSSLDKCTKSCLADAKCTFFYVFDKTDCYRFSKPLSQAIGLTQNSDAVLYDRSCFATPVSSAAPSATPSTICGAKEYAPSSNDLYDVAKGSSVDECSKSCLADSKCTFFYVFDKTDCYRFSKPLSQVSNLIQNNDAVLYDRSCFAAPAKVCGAKEYAPSYNDLYSVVKQSSVADCSQKCLSSAKCTFFYVFDKTDCYLFEKPFAQVTGLIQNDEAELYERSCFA